MSTTRSLTARRVGAVALAVALTGAALVGALPAQAATSNSFIAAPNGMVGVPETITVKAPGAVGQVVTIGLQIGATTQTLQTTIGSNGFGAVTWTPAAAGTWQISGQGSIASAGSTNITVAPMPTYTVLLAQNQLQQDASNDLLAAVVAPIGTLAPTGSVTLSTAGGAALATAPLTGLFGSATATAQVPWTPTAGGPTSIQASYQPASGGQVTSTSPVSGPNVSAGVTPLAVRWPANLYVGTTTLLEAVVGAGYPQGTVAFLMDGKGISGSIPTTNGVATLQWAPTASGIHTITANYTGSNPGFSGSSSQVVNIQAARPADNITVSTAAQPVWSVAQPIVMNAGTSATLTGTASSGTTVLFSEQCPCVIAGAVLHALGVGQCQVTAVTPGNATITPGSETYTVTVQKAPRK